MTHKLKTLIACMAIGLLAVSCQDDDPEKHSQNVDGMSSRTITGKEALDLKAELLLHMQSATAGAQHRDPDEFTVDATEVLELHDEYGNVNYTFRAAYAVPKKNTFLNVVMTEVDGGGKRTMLIEYAMSDDFAQDFAVKDNFDEFEGTMTFALLAADSNFPCPEVPDHPIPIKGGTPSENPGGTVGDAPGGGGGDDDSPGGIPGSGGDDSGHGNGNPFNQDLVNIKFSLMKYESWTLVSRSPRYFSVPPGDEDIFYPCDRGLVVGVLLPIVECAKVYNLVNNPNFNYRQNLVSLATTVNDEHNENGICLETNNTKYGFPPADEITVTAGPNTVFRALSHTHNVGKLSVFSFFDLVGIADLLFKNHINTGSFVATVSTEKGTHYALTISDVAKFKDFFFYLSESQNPEDAGKMTGSLNKSRELERKYYTDQTDPRIKVSDTNNAHVLSEFLNFMSEADMGTTLFETDATFKEFTQVIKVNGQIKKDSCN